MKYYIIGFLFLFITFFSTDASSQSQEFTDEASFLAALGTTVPTLEDYENCPTLNGFTLTRGLGGFGGCISICSHGGGTQEYNWAEFVEFTFDSPKNAFGTFLLDAGTSGAINVELMTDDGQMYTALVSPGGESQCNERFFGIISDMNFTMARFNADNNGDGIQLNNTYCANVELDAAVPTLSQWGVILLSLLILIFAVVVFKQKMTIEVT